MKKLLVLVLSAICLMMMFGCDKNNESKSSAVVTVNAYEDFRADVDPLVPLNYFGNVKLNEDKTFVKQGEKSLKLTITGDKTQKGLARPMLRQPLNLVMNDVNVQDLTKVKKFTLSVYNTKSEDVKMYVSLKFKEGNNGEKEYTLKSGWNDITYLVNSSSLGVIYTVTECYGLLFSFNTPSDEADVVYFDNLLAYTTDEEYKAQDLNLEEGEIALFDQIYQEYIVYPKMRHPNFAPKLSISGEKKIKGNALKVELVPNDGTFDTKQEAYSGFGISSLYMKNVGMEKYADDDVFTFSVYNSGTKRQRLFLELFNQKGTVYYKYTQIFVNPGEWYTFEETIRELDESIMGGTKNNATGSAGEIYISWEIHSLLEPNVLYFDEFKVVKAPKEAE